MPCKILRVVTAPARAVIKVVTPAVPPIISRGAETVLSAVESVTSKANDKLNPIKINNDKAVKSKQEFSSYMIKTRDEALAEAKVTYEESRKSLLEKQAELTRDKTVETSEGRIKLKQQIELLDLIYDAIKSCITNTNLEKIQALSDKIKSNPNLSLSDFLYNNPIKIALLFGSADAAELVFTEFSNHIDPEAVTYDGSTVMDSLKYCSNVSLTKRIVDLKNAKSEHRVNKEALEVLKEILDVDLKNIAELDNQFTQGEADKLGYTPLTYYIKLLNEQPEAEEDILIIIRALINAGADLFKVDAHKNEPLTMLIKLQNIELLQLVVTKTKLSTEIIEKIMVIANTTDNYEIILLFHFAKFKNEQFQENGDLFSSINVNGDTALTVAIELGMHECITTMIALGSNVNQPTEYGALPIVKAINQNDLSAIEILVSSGAKLDLASSINTGNVELSTPMQIAEDSGNEKIIEYLHATEYSREILVEHGFNITDLSEADPSLKLTPATFAIKTSDTLLLQWLIDSGANVAETDLYGLTPLMHAIRNCDVVMLYLLLDNGLIIGSQDLEFANNIVKSIPLDDPSIDIERKQQQEEFYQLLRIIHENSPVDISSRIDTINGDTQETLFTQAIKDKNFHVIRYLLYRGANPNAANANMQTPYELAAESNSQVIKDIFFSYEYSIGVEIPSSPPRLLSGLMLYEDSAKKYSLQQAQTQALNISQMSEVTSKLLSDSTQKPENKILHIITSDALAQKHIAATKIVIPNLAKATLKRFVQNTHLLIPANFDLALRHLILILRHQPVSDLDKVIDEIDSLQYIHNKITYKVASHSRDGSDLDLVCLKALQNLLPDNIAVQCTSVEQLNDDLTEFIYHNRESLPDNFSEMTAQAQFLLAFSLLCKISINVLLDDGTTSKIGKDNNELSFTIKDYQGRYYQLIQSPVANMSPEVRNIIASYYSQTTPVPEVQVDFKEYVTTYNEAFSPESAIYKAIERCNLQPKVYSKDIMRLDAAAERLIAQIRDRCINLDFAMIAELLNIHITVYTESLSGTHSFINAENKIDSLIKLNTFSPTTKREETPINISILKHGHKVTVKTGEKQPDPTYTYHALDISKQVPWLTPPSYSDVVAEQPKDVYLFADLDINENADRIEATGPGILVVHEFEGNIYHTRIIPIKYNNTDGYVLTESNNKYTYAFVLSAALALSTQINVAKVNIIEPKKQLIDHFTANIISKPYDIAISYNLDKLLISGKSLVEYTIKNKDFALLKRTKEFGLDLHEPSLKSETPIIIAAQNADWDLVKFIVMEHQGGDNYDRISVYDQNTGESLLDIVEAHTTTLRPLLDDLEVTKAQDTFRALSLLQFIRYQGEIADPAIIYATAIELNKMDWISEDELEKYELRAQYAQLMLLPESKGGLAFTELEYSSLSMILQLQIKKHTDGKIDVYLETEHDIISDAAQQLTKLEFIQRCIDAAKTKSTDFGDISADDILYKIIKFCIQAISSFNKQERRDIKEVIVPALKVTQQQLAKDIVLQRQQDILSKNATPVGMEHASHEQQVDKKLNDLLDNMLTEIKKALTDGEIKLNEHQAKTIHEYSEAMRLGVDDIHTAYKKAGKKIKKKLVITVPLMVAAAYAAPYLAPYVPVGSVGMQATVAKAIAMQAASTIATGRLDSKQFAIGLAASIVGFHVGELESLNKLSTAQLGMVVAASTSMTTNILNGELLYAIPLAALDGSIQGLSSKIGDVLVNINGAHAGNPMLREMSHYFVVGASSAVLHALEQKAIKGGELDLSQVALSGIQSALIEWSTKIATFNVVEKQRVEAAENARKAEAMKVELERLAREQEAADARNVAASSVQDSAPPSSSNDPISSTKKKDDAKVPTNTSANVTNTSEEAPSKLKKSAYESFWDMSEESHTDFYDRPVSSKKEAKLAAGTILGVAKTGLEFAMAVPLIVNQVLASPEEFDSVFNPEILTDDHEVKYQAVLDKYQRQHDAVVTGLNAAGKLAKQALLDPIGTDINTCKFIFRQSAVLALRAGEGIFNNVQKARVDPIGAGLDLGGTFVTGDFMYRGVKVLTSLSVRLLSIEGSRTTAGLAAGVGSEVTASSNAAARYAQGYKAKLAKDTSEHIGDPILHQFKYKTTNINTSDLQITHGMNYSKRKFAKFVTQIKTEGIQDPIKYVVHGGIKHIVDGHHRFFVARQLNLPNIPAIEVTLPYKGYKTVNNLVFGL